MARRQHGRRVLCPRCTRKRGASFFSIFMKGCFCCHSFLKGTFFLLRYRFLVHRVRFRGVMVKPVSRPDASKCTAKPCSALSARHSSEASLRLTFVTRPLSLFLMLTDLCVFFPSLFSPVIHMRSASAYPISLEDPVSVILL